MPKKIVKNTDSSILVSAESEISTENVTLEKKSRKPKAVKTSSKTSLPVTLDVSPSISGTSLVESSTSVKSPEPQNVVISDPETSLAEQSIEFLSKLQQLSLIISSLKVEYRFLEKKWSREIKVAQKQSSKRKRKAGNRAPSGFVKPTKISDELANFLGKDKGTEMARTDVTREINTYIRANKLQDKDNGRKINPDSKLTVLLKLKKTDELTYFNLQKYMSPHFAKAIKVEPVVVPVVSAEVTV
jgi:upstream activation factor subunit UAF30